MFSCAYTLHLLGRERAETENAVRVIETEYVLVGFIERDFSAVQIYP
jgi:hypothetical protein